MKPILKIALPVSLIAVLLLLFAFNVGAVTCTAGGTNTTNILLCKPADGETGWGTSMRANLDALDGKYASSGLATGTLTAGTQLTVSGIVASVTTTTAHGLSATPTTITCWIQNNSTELNYSSGDKVYLGSGMFDSGAGRAWSLVFDATNLSVVMSAAVDIALVNKTTFAVGNITPAKWDFRCIPYRLN